MRHCDLNRTDGVIETVNNHCLNLFGFVHPRFYFTISAPLLSEIKETPFQSTLHKDVTYRLRHVEEAWIHLLKSGDITKLKTLCMCNYDFLLAAVSAFLTSEVCVFRKCTKGKEKISVVFVVGEHVFPLSS